MSKFPDALCLSASPALQQFDHPLLQELFRQTSIALWEYRQSPDEPPSLDNALSSLHDYLRHNDRPIHLMGHGTSGLLALLYAQHYPEKVKSLTLLGVGAHPAIDWQAHYYAQLRLLPCSREVVLTQMVYNLLGYRSKPYAKDMIQFLEQDLLTSLSPHSLLKSVTFFSPQVFVPLMVCGSKDDMVTDSQQLQAWKPWLKAGDRLWQCPRGRHFFHYEHPKATSKQILDFWNTSGSQGSPSSSIVSSTMH